MADEPTKHNILGVSSLLSAQDGTAQSYYVDTQYEAQREHLRIVGGAGAATIDASMGYDTLIVNNTNLEYLSSVCDNNAAMNEKIKKIMTLLNGHPELAEPVLGFIQKITTRPTYAKLAAELTGDELEKRREKERTRKALQRSKLKPSKASVRKLRP